MRLNHLLIYSALVLYNSDLVISASRDVDINHPQVVILDSGSGLIDSIDVVNYEPSEPKPQTLDKRVRSYIAATEGECTSNSADSTCHQANIARKPREDSFTRSDQLDTNEQLRRRINLIDQLEVPQSTEDKISYYPANETQSSTLKQVFLLHRHGDRTPINFPPKDNLKDEPFWAFHGYGQLTNRGKKRLYMLGDIMRRRYGSFLGYSVNKNNRLSRASGSLRCIESAQVFLSSFLRLDLPESPDARQLVWDPNVNSLGSVWQPASVQTTSSTFDGMLAESADCVRLDQEYQAIDATEAVKNISIKYAHEARVMLDSYGMEMDHFYKWFWAGSQIEVERSYFPDKMKPEILAIYDRLQEAGILAFGAYQSTLISKRLRSGLLINDIVQNMKNNRAAGSQTGSKVKKFLHYAAHDMTNIVLLGMLDNWAQHAARPSYASNIVIELHQDPQHDEWFVRFFYMREVKSPQTEPKEMFMPKCSEGNAAGRCSLDRFEQLMQPYMIDSWQTWMSECGNDISSINPYKPGE